MVSSVHGDDTSAPEAGTTRKETLVQRVLGWLRAGYPEGVPQQDYVVLLGILRRSLTDAELDRVVDELTREAESGQQVMTRPLVAERISDVVKGPLRPEDLGRVSARLAAAGWPLGVPGLDDGAAAEDDEDSRPGLVGRVVGWLREGYPTGLPDQDFMPLVALLRRRLTDDEVRTVAQGLVSSGTLPSDRVDVGAAIAQVTSDLPSDEDVARVHAYLTAHGWPVEFDV